MNKWLIRGIALFFVNMACGQSPVALRCEMQTNPLGVEEPSPQLSWQLPWSGVGARQTGYQLVAAADSAFEEIIWDSQKVASDRSHLVEYAGPELVSRQRVYWKVRAWNENDTPSAFSEPAFWEMGLLEPEDWSAEWIRSELVDSAQTPVVEAWEQHLTLPQIATNSVLAQWMEGQMAKLSKVPYLRRGFGIDGEIDQARLYICGLGYHEVWLNGQRVSDRVFDPGISQYTLYGNYVVHDVTDLLKNGQNAIGVLLGGGWYDEPLVWASIGKGIYGQPGLIAQLEIRTKDGNVVRINTDESWKTGSGGLLRSHNFIGECFDSTLEPAGWTEEGFDDSAWAPALVSAPLTPQLKAQTVEPEHEIFSLKPKTMHQPQPGVWVFDMGEIVTGYVELRLDGQQQNPVHIRVSEWLRSAEIPLTSRTPELFYEQLDQQQALAAGMILGKARSSSVMTYVPGQNHSPFATYTQTYMPTGAGNQEVWKPRFALQAFRYVEVLGLESEPDLELVRGIMVHTDTARIGTFSSSNEVLNRLHQAALNSTLQNNHGMSWDNTTERAQSPFLFSWPAPLMVYNYDFARTYQKMLLDLRLFVTDQGKPVVCPWTRRAQFFLENAIQPIPEAATVDMLWHYYRFYGDQRELARHYQAVQDYISYYWNDAQRQRWLAAMQQPYEDRFFTDSTLVMPSAELPFNAWGDHTENYIGQTLVYGFNAETHRLFVTMGHFLSVLQQAEQIAGILNKPADAATYGTLQTDLLAALHSGWLYNADTKTYGGVRFSGGNIIRDLGTPVGNAIALSSGMVPEENRSNVVAQLVKDLKENYRGHFYGGHEGWNKISKALSDESNLDWVFNEITGTAFPQLGYITEQLDLNTFPEGFGILYGKVTTASACQSEFQGIMDWVHVTLCGLEPDPVSPAFKHFFVRPHIPQALDWVSTEFMSPYGLVTSAWKKENGRLVMQVNIPANCSATVIPPERKGAGNTTINGVSVDHCAGMIEQAGSAARPEYLLSSGRYTISVPFTAWTPPSVIIDNTTNNGSFESGTGLANNAFNALANWTGTEALTTGDRTAFNTALSLTGTAYGGPAASGTFVTTAAAAVTEGTFGAQIGTTGAALHSNVGVIQNTGHTVGSSDRYNLGFSLYNFGSASGMESNDAIQIRLFTSSNDSLSGGTLSLIYSTNCAPPAYSTSVAFSGADIGTVDALSIGKKLFISITPGVNAAADMVAIDNVTLTVATSSSSSSILAYEDWAAGFGLSGPAALRAEDPDGDGLGNLMEYALGSDPTFGNGAGFFFPELRTVTAANPLEMEYLYTRRSNAAVCGLLYVVEKSTNLVSGAWSTNGVIETGAGGVDGYFESVTNRISIQDDPAGFLRLKITRIGRPGEIVWTSGTGKFAGVDGANTISLNGTLVEAVSLGAAGNAPAGAVAVANGSKTESILFTQTDSLLNQTGILINTGIDTGNANWDSVVNSADWNNVNPKTLTLSGLMPGQAYQIELFLFDDRNATVAARTQTYSDGLMESLAFRNDNGKSIIGTFIANGDSQSITLIGSTASVTLNAYILRAISPEELNIPVEPDRVIRLWNGDAPGLVTPVLNPETVDSTFTFRSVSVPELWVYLPDTPAQNRPAVMICPGGGFGSVGMGLHVLNAVKQFNDQGIVVVGLKYRTNYGGNNYVQDSLADSERAMRLIRYHATGWGIDPNRICVQGYSAGGTVCMNLLGNFDAGNAGSSDPVERLSSRPDSVALMCPWPNSRPSSAYPMPTDPPPAFIASAQDDTIAPTAFALEIGAALTNQGGTVEWFIVPTGGHSAFHYGVSTSPGAEWPTALKAIFP